MNNKYPEAYLQYLLHFHATRDYFECHEILEDHWKIHGDKCWLALIQLAVAVYHERAGNTVGSRRLYQKVLFHIKQDSHIFKELAIDTEELKQLINSRIKSIMENGKYEPMNIPLIDKNLINDCCNLCSSNQLTWCHIEDLDDKALILRHKLRDRSEVIKERYTSLLNKQRERQGM